MEVMALTPPEFRFDSALSTPYGSAPTSPRRFGEASDRHYYYTSAPGSPSAIQAMYSKLDSLALGGGGKFRTPSSASMMPFGWEEQSGMPNLKLDDGCEDVSDPFDFAFDFSALSDAGSLPLAIADAEDLFEAGKIRALKPPRRPNYHSQMNDTSPRSPNGVLGHSHPARVAAGGRGREATSGSRKGSRSLSPLRREVGGLTERSPNFSVAPSAATSSASSSVKKSGSKKWRLMDFFLFRSASEGRATGNKNKDPLSKHTMFSATSFSMIRAGVDEDSKSSSFRSTDSSHGSTRRRSSAIRPGGEDSKSSSFRSTDSHGSMRRGTGRPPAAGHEMQHYVVKKAAAAEEMKRKTALPYRRQGFFTFFRMNPASLHRSSRVVGNNS